MPSRCNLHFKFLTFGHSGAQPWAPESSNVVCVCGMAKCNQLIPVPFKWLTYTTIIQTYLNYFTVISLAAALSKQTQPDNSELKTHFWTFPEVLSLLLTDAARCDDDVEVLVGVGPAVVGVGGSSSSGVNGSVFATDRYSSMLNPASDNEASRASALAFSVYTQCNQ